MAAVREVAGLVLVGQRINAHLVGTLHGGKGLHGLVVQHGFSGQGFVLVGGQLALDALLHLLRRHGRRNIVAGGAPCLVALGRHNGVAAAHSRRSLVCCS